MSHSEDAASVTGDADRSFYMDSRGSSPAAVAWLDRAIRTLLRSPNPYRGMEAAAEARSAARTLAASLGSNEVPFQSVERRIEALVRLDVPDEGELAPRRRRVLGEQLLQWASEAYHESRLRLRKPADLP